MNNIYYSPERFGLTVMWMVEHEPNYDFDMCVVWKDREGQLYWAQDAGCSCPCPFEDFGGVDDLTPLTMDSYDELRRFVQDNRYPAADVRDLLDRVRRALRRRS